ncbi:sushi, nidogen and EGF-like domain-containing protein 1 isoform X1 [Ruditapes philippinarum]|uniref:sushi, nidogen and EGF-like domain-containing protein 1 isoform X1 n=1 Tax=Ruditapes philippinarum TaxID=129788 RepID=UPI00295AC5CD|nr:sushi, nidogen and EGF-like domain-containing protein 1 isoform X1 [Ruditapes philippinarum]
MIGKMFSNIKTILVGLTILIVFNDVNADSCSTACTWITWESWGSCSSSCGGGYQIRNRDACCRSDATFDECMNECHMQSSDSRERRCCNTFCSNGGSWTYLDRSSCTGRCTCPKGFKGSCCQTACKYIPHCLPNETECNIIGAQCLKCSPPYISTGWKGTCRSPLCTPMCKNNGTCISDNVCDCAPGFIGERCNLGGSMESYLVPTLHAVEQKPFRPLSWYDQPSFSEFGRVCHIKITMENTPAETLVLAESRNLNGETYGNFTTGPIDSKGSLNATTRTACLQIRCPSDAKGNDLHTIDVQVYPVTGTGTCTIMKTKDNINVTVRNQPMSHDKIQLQIDYGNNYGPAYGLYFGMGTRDNAIYATRQQCLSGTNFNVNEINTSNGVFAVYKCLQ